MSMSSPDTGSLTESGPPGPTQAAVLSRRDRRRVLRDCLGWGVASWRFALSAWERGLGDVRGAHVLDIGGRNGGLSLHFALKGCRVVCSDLEIHPQAVELHRRYGVSESVRYEKIDATAIAGPDNQYDIVCFKSVLASLGRLSGFSAQQQAVREMHRVLKPGGTLCFAENLEGSWAHRLLRKYLVPWGRGCRYVTKREIPELFAPFAGLDIVYSGFLGAFGYAEWQRDLLHGIDVLLDPLVPDASKYVFAGCARK